MSHAGCVELWGKFLRTAGTRPAVMGPRFEIGDCVASESDQKPTKSADVKAPQVRDQWSFCGSSRMQTCQRSAVEQYVMRFAGGKLFSAPSILIALSCMFSRMEVVHCQLCFTSPALLKLVHVESASWLPVSKRS